MMRLVLNIIAVFYAFQGLSVVCDEHFVPALEAIADHWALSPDVAGATLMAAGGSAPELFTSLIGTFKQSDVGFGTIVGSAVFNVLFVIGACAIFTHKPLALTRWPLFRDSLCFVVALGTVALFLKGTSEFTIQWWESLFLLVLYGGYIGVMRKNEALCAWVESLCVSSNRTRTAAATTTEPPPHVPANPTTTTDDIALEVQEEDPTASAASTEATFHLGLVTLLTDTAHFSDGVSFRLVAREWGTIDEMFHRIDTDGNGSIDKAEFATMLCDLDVDMTSEHTDALFDKLDTDKNDQIDLHEFTCWYLESEERLKKQAVALFKAKAQGDTMDADTLRTFLTELSVSDEEASRLLTDSTVGLEGGGLTETQFVEWYHTTPLWQQAADHAHEEAETLDGISLALPDDATWWNKVCWLWLLPHLLCFTFTIADVRVPTRGGALQYRAYRAFWQSIVWIGAYSYLMVECATSLGASLGIPDVVMGLTVLAAGTSVPDLLSSVAVARQGHGDMAVSSSIGSNIFDVLVGLPFPWLLYTVVTGDPVQVNAYNLVLSLLILIGMLMCFVGTIHVCGWRLTKPLGFIMLGLYILFVFQDLARIYGWMGW